MITCGIVQAPDLASWGEKNLNSENNNIREETSCREKDRNIHILLIIGQERMNTAR